MSQLYYIQYDELYFHSFLPKGRVLWCDTIEDAQYLTEDEADCVLEMIINAKNGPKRYRLQIYKE